MEFGVDMVGHEVERILFSITREACLQYWVMGVIILSQILQILLRYFYESY